MWYINTYYYAYKSLKHVYKRKYICSELSDIRYMHFISGTFADLYVINVNLFDANISITRDNYIYNWIHKNGVLLIEFITFHLL